MSKEAAQTVQQVSGRGIRKAARLGALSSTALLLLVAACGGGGEEPADDAAGTDGADAEQLTLPDYYPENYSEIVEGCESESGVDVYGILPLENWQIILEGFSQLHPDVEVRPLDLGTTEVFERYTGEAAGGGSAADLLQSTASGAWWTIVNDDDAIEPYESPELDDLPDPAKPLPGVYTMSTDPLMLMYNKSLLSEDQWPESMADVVQLAEEDPELVENKLTSYNITENFAGWWWLAQEQPEQFEEWFSVIGPMTRPEASGGPMIEKVAIGEYLISYYNSSAVLGLPIWDGPGAEVLGYAVATDSAPLFARNIGIPQTADSPNCAKLLLDYLMSEQGQELLPEANLVPSRLGVDVPDDWFSYESLEAQVDEGALILAGPAEELADPATYDEFRAEWQALFEQG
jgi:iron(III) transport system substrate-binding protein